MECATLGELIETLEIGTKLHISITFLDEYGNRKTQRTRSQSIHDSPVCLTIKHQLGELASCYRCRNTVQKAVIQRRRSMAGVCTNGVYEYCRPVVYEDRVICVIFIGNILTQDPSQREKLEKRVGSELLETMEQACSKEDCVKVANVLESYIKFLFDHYGIENTSFDPFVENVKNYQHLKDQADFILYVSDMYYDGCMRERNARMVELGTHCIAYWNGSPIGGTAQTVRMAKSANLLITNLWQTSAQ